MMERAFRAGLAGLSAAVLLLFIATAVVRLNDPFALHPVEGAWLDEIARVAGDQPLYAEPSLTYVALPAMPGFALVGAPLARIFGPEPWVPRVIALLATLAMAGLAWKVVRRETESPILGLAAAGLLLGGAAAVSLDSGRPEAVAGLLALGALTSLRFTTGIWGALLAAGLMVGAWLASHHALWFVGAAAVYLFVNDRRRLIPFALAVAMGGGGSAWLLSKWLGPWFTFHAFDLAIHGVRPDMGRAAQVVGPGLMGLQGTLVLSVLLAAALPAPLWRGRPASWWWAALAGAVGSAVGAMEPRASSPGLALVVFPLAIAGPVALTRVVTHLSAWPGSERAGRTWVLPAALGLALVPLLGGLETRIPREPFRSEHQVLVERLRALPGPVLAPGFSWAAAEAGKGRSFDPVAFDALAGAHGNRLLANDPRFLERLFASLRGEARPPLVVVGEPLDGSDSTQTWATLTGHLRRVAEWPELSDSPAPHLVYEPISPVDGKESTPVPADPAPGAGWSSGVAPDSAATP